jgi:hypothetical protein
VHQLAVLSKSETIDWIIDPALHAPDYFICWEGTRWSLRQAGSTQPIELGSTLTAANVLAKLPKKKIALLVNIPPPQELSASLAAEPTSPLKFVSSSAAAKYLLVGTYAHENIAYAWVARDVIEEAKPPAATSPTEAACSSSSPYPARTDWKRLAASDAMASTGRELMAVATQLTRIHEWLQLPVPAAKDSYPYHLVLKRDDDSAIQDDASGGDHVSLFLKSDQPVPAGTTARWVYVMDLDCQGNGSLLYPKAGVNNHLPVRGSLRSEIPLEQSGFHFGKPYGTDTLVLLTTNEELPDPSLLTFQGVSSGAARGAPVPDRSPLEHLLGSTIAGKRGAEPDQPLPTSWGVQYVYIHTHSPGLAGSQSAAH